MNCIICKKPLRGYQKKYCGGSCKDYQRQRTQSAKAARLSILAKKPCVVCGGVFQPVRKANIVCSIACRITRNKMQKSTARVRANCPPPGLRTSHHTKPHFNKNCSCNKKEILRFLKNGGKITRLPSAPVGKTPEINMAYGWIPEELFGSALMYKMENENE